jgi:hypothetical protein
MVLKICSEKRKVIQKRDDFCQMSRSVFTSADKKSRRDSLFKKITNTAQYAVVDVVGCRTQHHVWNGKCSFHLEKRNFSKKQIVEILQILHHQSVHKTVQIIRLLRCGTANI